MLQEKCLTFAPLDDYYPSYVKREQCDTDCASGWQWMVKAARLICLGITVTAEWNCVNADSAPLVCSTAGPVHSCINSTFMQLVSGTQVFPAAQILRCMNDEALEVSASLDRFVSLCFLINIHFLFNQISFTTEGS